MFPSISGMGGVESGMLIQITKNSNILLKMDEFADHKILVLKLNAAPAVLLLCTDAQKYSSTMLVVHKSFVDQMISFYVNIYL